MANLDKPSLNQLVQEANTVFCHQSQTRNGETTGTTVFLTLNVPMIERNKTMRSCHNYRKADDIQGSTLNSKSRSLHQDYGPYTKGIIGSCDVSSLEQSWFLQNKIPSDKSQGIPSKLPPPEFVLRCLVSP